MVLCEEVFVWMGVSFALHTSNGWETGNGTSRVREKQ